MSTASALPRMPTIADRGDLVDAWKAAATLREKARIEDLLWLTTNVQERENLRAEGQVGHGRHRWVGKLVDAPEYEISMRARLPYDSADVDELWARVAKDEFSVGMAVRQLVEARKVVTRDKLPLREAITRLLSEYDTWPKRLDKGRLAGIKPATSFSRVRTEKKRQRPFMNDDREFWTKMRALLQEFVQRRTAGAPPHVADMLIGEFERELKVLTTGWSGKMERAKQRNIDNAVLLVTRAKVSRACGILNMDPPSRHGKPVDMKVAQSRKRTLAKTYHPDVSPHTRDQYEAVLAAYADLEDYDEMLQGGPAAQ